MNGLERRQNILDRNMERIDEFYGYTVNMENYLEDRHILEMAAEKFAKSYWKAEVAMRDINSIVKEIQIPGVIGLEDLLNHVETRGTGVSFPGLQEPDRRQEFAAQSIASRYGQLEVTFNTYEETREKVEDLDPRLQEELDYSPKNTVERQLDPTYPGFR